jgi:tetrathionate reductase subunit A
MSSLSRRDFLRVAALMGGTSLFAGCHFFPESGPVPEYIEGAPGVDPLESLVGVQNVYTVCGLCAGACGIRCRVAGGKLVKIDGSPYHPASSEPFTPFETPLEEVVSRGGAVCAVGGSGIQTVYNPFRVARPLKRVGPRGSGKWRALSWDEAAKELVFGGDLFGEGTVAGLKEIRETRRDVAVLTGNADWGSNLFLASFLRGFPGGAFQLDRARSLDHLFESVRRVVWPDLPGPIAPDYRHARGVLSFGDAPLDSGVPLLSIARDIAEARTSGGGFKWAVVDPRLSVSASKADLWAPVIPGREDRLALAIMRILSETSGPDFRFPNESIRKAALDAPASAHAEACGLPLETATRMARFLREAGPAAAVIPGTGILAQEHGAERAELILSLNYAVGARPGSGGLMRRDETFLKNAERRILGAEVSAIPIKPCGAPTDALIIWAADPVYDDPSLIETFFRGRDRARLAIAVTHEITKTAGFADYILPDTTYLERWDICKSAPAVHGAGFGIRRPVLGLVGVGGDYRSILPQARLMEDILGRLAADAGLPGFERLESGGLKPAKSFYDQALKIVTEEFERSIGGGNADPDKLEAAVLRGGRFVAAPVGREGKGGVTKDSNSLSNIDAPSIAADQPPRDAFRLILFSLPFHRGPACGLNKWLIEIMPENKLLISSHDASRLGVRDLDEIIVNPFEGDGPRLTAKAQVVPGIRPGVVAMARGFGRGAGAALLEQINGKSLGSDPSLGKGVNPAGLTWVKIGPA